MENYYGDINKDGFKLVKDIGIGFIAIKEDKYGVVDRFGEVIIDFNYDRIPNSYKYLVKVCLNGKCGLLGINKEFYLDCIYDYIEVIKDSNSFVYSTEGKFGYLLIKGYSVVKKVEPTYLTVDEAIDEANKDSIKEKV